MSETPLTGVRLATEEGLMRRTFRHREYTIARDAEPDAEPWMFSFECQVCEEHGTKQESSDDALDWVLGHLKRFPEHLSYREHITRPYRAIPGRWL
jgi:hypothetical protein